MNAYELADAMEIRASIRRKATSRKSVTEGANDRLADQLDQAATMLRQQQADLKDADKYALELERLYEDAKAEIEALKSVVYWLKENRPEVWDDIQKWRKQ